MRTKLLAGMILGLFITVFSAVTILAYTQHRATVRRFNEQYQAIISFATTNVEMGISAGNIRAIKKFIEKLGTYPIFAGAIVYDEELTPLMTSPANASW